MAEFLDVCSEERVDGDMRSDSISLYADDEIESDRGSSFINDNDTASVQSETFYARIHNQETLPYSDDMYETPAQTPTPEVKKHYAKNWCFTLNNYTDEEYDKLCQLVDSDICSYIIIGKEQSQTLTPHLQCYVQLCAKKRLPFLKANISARAHFEVARSSAEVNQKYCKKDGDFLEMGNLTRQGSLSGSKLMQMSKSIAEGRTCAELVDTYGDFYIRNYDKTERFQRKKNTETCRNAILQQVVREHTLNSWQQYVAHNVVAKQLHPRDTRTINWIFDIRGNTGKSWFSKYLMGLYGYDVCLVIDNVEYREIAYLLKTSHKIVVFDVSRSRQDNVNYMAIEKIKTGVMTSTKYQPEIKIVDPPVVIVFSNTHPNVLQFSQDRWNILEIREGDIVSRDFNEFKTVDDYRF